MGKKFIKWRKYPKGQSNKMIEIKNLINQNDNEEIGEFNTLKNRDWIIFNVDKANIKTYPLKIRTTPVKKGYLVGIASGGEGNFGVIGSVKYLIELFEKYGVKYQYD